MVFGKRNWGLVPVDPQATAVLLNYLEQGGYELDTVKLSDQQGRCGHVAYGKSRHVVRYVVDERNAVHMDALGLLPSFEALWKASPCWYPYRPAFNQP